MLWMLRRHTTTTMTIWACDDTDTGGEIGVKINGGAVVPGDTLSATYNFCGLVTATGLMADTEYSYQLTLDDVDVTGASGTFRTAPAAGSDVDLLFVICALEAEVCFAPMVGRETADACFTSEFVYIDEAEYSSSPVSATSMATLYSSNNPLTASTIPAGADYVAFLTSYRKKHRNSYVRDGSVAKSWRHRFAQKFPLRMMWDNHEFESATTQSAPGQNQFDAAFQAAYEYNFMGNPENGDADLDTLPEYYNGSGMVAKPAYFREVIGDVEVLVPDYISYSGNTTIRTLNDAARGDELQRAWLTARITASTAKFLVLFNAQRIELDSDDWIASGGLFETINAKAQTVIVITGDIHRPYARLISHPTYAPDRVLLDVGASPLRQISNGDFTDISGQTVYHDPLPAGADNQTAYSAVHSAAARAACNWTYCKVEVRPNGSSDYGGSHIKISLKNPLTGNAQWSAYIPEGLRTPVELVAGTIDPSN